MQETIPELRFFAPLPTAPGHSLAEVVAEGLSKPQKSLPCRLFYDADGSALFEQICTLPEYYLTRTEQSILDEFATDILGAVGSEISFVELGSGSSRKTRRLISAALARQSALHYTAIDISAHFLRESAAVLLTEYPRLRVTAIAAEYNHGIDAAPASSEPRLFLFLGSNIGNFDRPEAVAFLSRISNRMMPDDRLLVGIDLLKDRDVIERAYNDSAGVTAAFNGNILRRINTELGGDFDSRVFVHAAPFVEELARIEMRLVSARRQEVSIRALDRSYIFERGEYLHTENSHKYSLALFDQMSRLAGLRIAGVWQDTREWFAEVLLERCA